MPSRRSLGYHLVAAVACVSLHAQPPDRPVHPPATIGETYGRRFQATQPGLTANGASSCASTQCHGGATPRPGEVFKGNEYDLWHASGKGIHFRAYKVLYEDPRSDRMVRILYGPNAVAKERPECLACHALNIPSEKQGRAWSLEDGVTCELCHGRSEVWMGKHSNPRHWRGELTESQRSELGFYDTRNLMRRAEKCLQCHGGTEDKQISHPMLAAGHPPLRFELTSDLERVPKHWNDGQCYLAPDEGSYFHARSWAVGQAVALRESLYRLASWAEGGGSPDYSFFECYACHHDLKPTTWRQLRGFAGAPGEPVWDASTAVLVRPLVKLALPDKLSLWDTHIDDLTSALRIHTVQLSDIRTTSHQFSDAADELARKLNGERLDRQRVIQLLRGLTGDRERLAALGYASAAKTFLAMDALYRRALAEDGEKPSNHAAIYKGLAKLHDMLFDEKEKETPWLYDPTLFVAEMSELAKQFAELSNVP